MLLAVTQSLNQLTACRSDLQEKWIQKTGGKQVTSTETLWPEASVSQHNGFLDSVFRHRCSQKQLQSWLAGEEAKNGLKPDQVLIIMLKHIAELGWFMIESVNHKKSSSLPLILQFPFVLDVSKQTFESLHHILRFSKAQLAQKVAAQEFTHITDSFSQFYTPRRMRLQMPGSCITPSFSPPFDSVRIRHPQPELCSILISISIAVLNLRQLHIGRYAVLS